MGVYMTDVLSEYDVGYSGLASAGRHDVKVDFEFRSSREVHAAM